MTTEELIEDLIDTLDTWNADETIPVDLVPVIVNVIVDRLMILGRIVLDPPAATIPGTPFEAQAVFKNKMRYDIDALRIYLYEQLDESVMHTRAVTALEDAYRYSETAIAAKHPIPND